MLITEFETKIKEIDNDLSIRPNRNSPDIAGIYWKDIYVGIAVPPIEIKDEDNSGYTDALGYPYHSIKFVNDNLVGKVEKIKRMFNEDPEIFK